jgi:gliding motility-associated-like protein
MRFLFICTILFLCNLLSVAQENLVPNFSFETYSACPTSADQFSNTTDWFSPNAQFPDYFHTCQLIPFTYGAPFTVNGYQKPKSGEAFTGITVVGNGPFTHREYIAVGLTSSLKEDTDYLITFYVNLANAASVGITELGAYLSNTPVSDTSSKELLYIPQIVSPTGYYLTDTSSWIKISGMYTALGGEKYITIGNFKNDSLTDTLHLNSAPALSYYFVDDISVVQSDSTSEVANVFTPNEDGMNDDWIVRNLPKNSQVKIYDRWGVMVGGVESGAGIQGTFKWDGRTSSGERCVNGTYYYVITTDKTTKGVIQLIR